MERRILLARLVTVGCLCAGTLIAVACSMDSASSPTRPSAGVGTTAPVTARIVQQVGASSLTPSAARSGELHITKECSQYNRTAGSFCTIVSSSLDAIEAGSRITYSQDAGPTSLDSDIVLDLPGPGNNQAFGHCYLSFATASGVCTLSGGTGKFMWLQANVVVTLVDPATRTWRWDGTYSFSRN